MEPITTEVIDTLRTFNSPTVANAIEVFDVRPRNTGFMNSTIRCQFPNFGPMVGYAVTAKIRALNPPGDKALHPSMHWENIIKVPAPRVVVVQDLDDPPAVGSMWGEVQSNIHRALGCIGVVTDGGGRDLEEVYAMGFHYFARAAIVSHAYIHIVETGTPVEVGGSCIEPGDLIHADRHGVQTIPKEIATQIADRVNRVEKNERPIIEFCKSNEFSVEGLKEVWDSFHG